MALPTKTKIGGIKSSVPAQRQFTDRKEFQVSFQDALAKVNNKDIPYNILTFYGVGGVGKSSLQKHLKKEHLNKDENAIYSWVDFEEQSQRQEHKAFRILANNFKTNFQIPFTAFNLAYMIYWCKAFPEYEIKKEGLPFLEEGSQLSNIVNIFSETGGIVGTGLGFLGYIHDKIKEFSFDKELRDELKELNHLEANAIENELGRFFAYDIDKYIEKNPSKKVVIFLDTYEALWRDNRTDGNAYSQDEWIRNNLIGQLPNALFVICGREKIKWADYDNEWEPYLNQHILDNLSQIDSKDFLSSCNIKDEAIQDSIYKATQGYPYYLDLCVDTYSKIQKSGKTPSVDDFKDLSQDKIFKRFMEYLNETETNILYTLSHARFFTKEIFQLLLGNKYTNSDLRRVNNFSFISEDNGIYYMHDIMRKSLLNSPANAEEHVNKILFDFYDANLQNLDVKNITQKSLESLPEAFYHKEKIGNLEELYDWYIDPFNILISAAKYKVLLEPSLRLKELSEKVLGEEHSYTATSYNNLAELYRAMGEYEKALPLHEKALTISKKVLGEEHPDTATSYNNFALLYNNMGEYEKALPLCEKALNIKEKIFGEEHPDTAGSYNNLATLYNLMGEYEKTLPLHEKALNIREKIFGEEHPDTAGSYNNIAELYRAMGEYEKAIPLYEKALNIREKIFGEEHPDTTGSYNNIAELYRYMREYEKAIPLYEKALTISKKVLGEEHPNTATFYNNFALLYNNMGEYEKALPMYEKALTISKTILGEWHPDTAGSYNNLAELYKDMGEYKKALPMYVKALTISKKVLGEKHPYTTGSYSNLAIFYYKQGEIDKALEIALNGLGADSLLYRELLEVRDTILNKTI